MGVQLLRNTRKNHLIEDCGLRHGCPAPEKENTRTSIVQLPDGRQEIRIPPVSGSSRQGDALITLILTNVQPGDIIEAHAPGGCFLDISSDGQ